MTIADAVDYSLIGYTKATEGGFGHVGIETRPAALPASGDATYTGFWGGQVYPLALTGTFDAVGGAMEMILDFDGGVVDGRLDSGFVPVATINGELSDNGVSGTFDFTTGDYVGSVDFAGKAYGDLGESVAGVYGDTVTNTTTSETQVFTGTFTGSK